MPSPDLDVWLPNPIVRVSHLGRSAAGPSEVWDAAQRLRLRDTRVLGRLVRWRIPGVPADVSFSQLFSEPPFAVLEQHELALVSGLVGRIWTLRRDYPHLSDPGEFRSWSRPGTVRVLFANWAAPADGGGSTLRSETRLQAFGVQGRLGLASVRPLIRGFQHLVGSDAIAAALRAVDQPS